MNSGIRSLVSSGRTLEQRLDTVSNNLSNSSTDGYKGDQLTFREVLSHATRIAPESSQEAFQSHEYLELYTDRGHSAVTVDEVGKDFSKGTMRQTDNALDIAIESEGFFSISTPQGERYTRSGSFALDSKGQIVTNEGYPVLGKKGNITVTGSDIVIDDSGNISVDGRQQDQLKIVNFRDTNRLQKLGSTFYASVDHDNVPLPVENVRVSQGVVEGSNVDTIREMTRMIQANRSYETVQKALSNIDTMDERAISIAKA